jgi:hypothetical protein
MKMILELPAQNSVELELVGRESVEPARLLFVQRELPARRSLALPFRVTDSLTNPFSK